MSGKKQHGKVAMKTVPKQAHPNARADSDDEEDNVDETIRRGQLNDGDESSEAEAADSDEDKDFEASSEEEEEDENEQSNETEGTSRIRRGRRATRSRRNDRDAERPMKRSRFLDVEADVDYEEEEDHDGDEDADDLVGDDFVDERDVKAARETYEAALAGQRPRMLQASNAVDERSEIEAEVARIKALHGRHKSSSVYLKSLMGDDSTGALLESGLLVPETLLMPAVSDPKLWLIKCAIGKERDIVVKLYRRLVKLKAMSETAAACPIKSIVYRESLRGYIYIEAHRSIDIVGTGEGSGRGSVVLQGLQHLLYGSKMKLVPIPEMTSVLKLPPPYGRRRAARAGLEGEEGRVTDGTYLYSIGGWARIKRGKYAGDLAYIVDVSDITETARIRVLPRLDIFDLKPSREMPNASPGQSKAALAKKRREWMIKARPAGRLFSPKEVSDATRERQLNAPGAGHAFPSLSKHGGYWYFGGEAYRDGYLEKDIKWTGLLPMPEIGDTTGDAIQWASWPSLGEVSAYMGLPVPVLLQTLDRSTGSADALSPATTTTAVSDELLTALKRLSIQGYEGPAGSALLPSSLQKGDVVQVIQGEFMSSLGTILDLDDEKAQVLVSRESGAAVTPTHTMPLGYLAKYFRAGDHVKVMHGKYANETGMIISIDDTGTSSSSLATLYADGMKQVIQVLTRDIRDTRSDARSDAAASATVPGGAVGFATQDVVLMGGDSSAAAAGLVLKIDVLGKAVTVLDAQNVIRHAVPLSHCQHTPMRGSPMGAFDGFGNRIVIGSRVRLAQGNGEVGLVKGVWRGTLWCKVKEEGPAVSASDAGGYVAVRAGQVGLLDSDGQTIKGMAGTPLGPRGLPQFKTPTSLASHRGGVGRKDREALLSKTVMITGGPYKGKMGMIKNLNVSGAGALAAEVELHTDQCKCVTVERSQLQLFESGTSVGGGVGSYSTPHHLGYGTGFHPSAMTPSYGGGSKTPGWFAEGSKTPGAFMSGMGNRTPSAPGYGYGDQGSKTPTATYGGYHSEHGGNRTPALGQGYKTPNAVPHGYSTPAPHYHASSYTSGSESTYSQTPAGHAHGYMTPAGSRTPGGPSSSYSFDDEQGQSAQFGASRSKPWGGATPLLPLPPPLLLPLSTPSAMSHQYYIPGILVYIPPEHQQSWVIESIDKANHLATLHPYPRSTSDASKEVSLDAVSLVRPTKRDRVVCLGPRTGLCPASFDETHLVKGTFISLDIGSKDAMITPDHIELGMKIVLHPIECLAKLATD